MMMVEKEEIIITTTSSPTKRTARFLTPAAAAAFDFLPPSAFRYPKRDPNPNNLLLKKGRIWVNPLKNWGEWVRRMQKLHEPTWRAAGIYNAILNSTYSASPDTNLVLALIDRWCPLSNTFVFPFAEATITLEDVAVLGGFSVLGEPLHDYMAYRPPPDCDVEILRELDKGRRAALTNKHWYKKVTGNSWLRVFMGSGSIAEHAAFLVLWLSRHVLRYAHDDVGQHLYELACCLARGTRVALAPSVLASLYNDLTLLKRASTSKVVIVWSLMHLVQIWGWERFPTLGPQPNPRIKDESRMSRWNGVRACRENLEKGSELENVRSAIDSGSESFVWRPYGDDERERCWQLRNIYPDKEKWMSVGPGMREDFKSFAKIVRVSELVGINCIQPYYPHRVSRQFGLDQEIPCRVAGFDKSIKIAWKKSIKIAWTNYNREIRDEKLYIPAWSFKSGVTSRYLEWWKQMKLVQENDAAKVKDRKRKLTAELLKNDIATSSRGKKKKAAIMDFADRNKILKADKFVTNNCKSPSSTKSPGGIENDHNLILGRIDENKIPYMKMNEVSANSKHDEAEINVPSNDEFFPHVEPQKPLSSPVVACNDDDERSESRMEPTKVQGSPTQTLDEFGKEINYGNDVNMEPLLEPAKVCENTTRRDEVVAEVAVEGKERIVGDGVDSVNKDISEANANLYTLEMLRTMPLEARISRLEILAARLKDERMALKSVKK